MPLRGCDDGADGPPDDGGGFPACACFMAERSFPPFRELGTGAGGAVAACAGAGAAGVGAAGASPPLSPSPPSTRWLTKTLAWVLRYPDEVAADATNRRRREAVPAAMADSTRSRRRRSEACRSRIASRREPSRGKEGAAGGVGTVPEEVGGGGAVAMVSRYEQGEILELAA